MAVPYSSFTPFTVVATQIFTIAMFCWGDLGLCQEIPPTVLHGCGAFTETSSQKSNSGALAASVSQPGGSGGKATQKKRGRKVHV
eukprot:1664327-Amphidinium_carterae.1